MMPLHTSAMIEHNEKDNQFFKTRQEVEVWLKKMEIKNYEIDDSLVVNVNNTVNISQKKLPYLPVQFGEIKGDFIVFNSGLRTCLGMPFIVRGGVYASQNKLKTLEDSPLVIERDYHVGRNQLTTIKGVPDKIGGDFVLSSNKIKNFKFMPSYIGGDFFCYKNPIPFSQYEKLESVIGGDITFVPPEGMDVSDLEEFVDSVGDITISYDYFKKYLLSKKLSEKLENDLMKPILKIEAESQTSKKFKI